MKYRKLADEDVSILGFGCMRFPVIDDDPKKIDEAQVKEMFETAIDNGINYFDTAYVYHGGESEKVLGKLLGNGLREKIKIADKMPVWEVNCEEDFDRILEEQLKRLNTDYIDYYLLHSLGKDTFENKVLKYGLIDKIKKAKADGKVRHIGFSFHDNTETFKRIIDSNPDWEFCQIQFNYIDINSQAGIEGLKYAGSKGIDVIVMEPLLGGKLANPSLQVKKTLGDYMTPVEWAFRFVWSWDEVSLLLSGMSAIEQVNDNIIYASRAEKLSESEKNSLLETKKVFDTMALVPCTKCAYCMPCPAGLDIPKIYEAYNASAVSGKDNAKKIYEESKLGADACLKCHACEKICPQHIETTKLMPEIADFFS